MSISEKILKRPGKMLNSKLPNSKLLLSKMLFSMVLALALVMSILPAPVKAAVPNYVYVGDVIVTTGYETEQDLFGGKVTYKVTEGVAVLTLNGVSVPTGRCSNLPGGIIAALYSDGDLTIELIGENTVVAPDLTTGSSYGMSIAGDLIVKSESGGSLTVKGGNAVARSEGIFCLKNLSVLGNAVLTGEGSEAEISYGVYCNEETATVLTVSESGVLNGFGGNAQEKSYGVLCKSIVLEDSGKITGTGKEGEYSYGVEGGSINITDNAKLVGNGGKAVDASYGVNCTDIDISVKGEFTGNGGEAEEYSYGVFCDSVDLADNAVFKGIGGMATGAVDSSVVTYLLAAVTPPPFVPEQLSYSYGVSSLDVSITGGVFDGEGGRAYSSCGADMTQIEISGGKFTVKGGEAYYESIGVRAWSTVAVSGGEIYAEGKEAKAPTGISRGFNQSTSLTSADAFRMTGGILTAISAEGGRAIESGVFTIAPTADKYLMTRISEEAVTDWLKVNVYDITSYPFAYTFHSDSQARISRNVRVSEAYEVSGKVIKLDGDPIEGAKVEVAEDTSSFVTTPATGEYSFILENGTYEITAEKAGYESGELEVTVADAAVTDADIALAFLYDLEGGGTHIKQIDKEGLVFTSNGEYEDFDNKVEVDGVEIPDEAFNDEPGS
ncbi:MAG: carboxypeptidase regulatory-like domain-containing protein, partial [Eubacteriaceae bacterium]|nr:carboxypeptidase regulatory-like domain-containing protein [Eubacteriaceae bacterium]